MDGLAPSPMSCTQIGLARRACSARCNAPSGRSAETCLWPRWIPCRPCPAAPWRALHSHLSCWALPLPWLWPLASSASTALSLTPSHSAPAKSAFASPWARRKGAVRWIFVRSALALTGIGMVLGLEAAVASRTLRSRRRHPRSYLKLHSGSSADPCCRGRCWQAFYRPCEFRRSTPWMRCALNSRDVRGILLLRARIAQSYADLAPQKARRS